MFEVNVKPILNDNFNMTKWYKPHSVKIEPKLDTKSIFTRIEGLVLMQTVI